MNKKSTSSSSYSINDNSLSSTITSTSSVAVKTEQVSRLVQLVSCLDDGRKLVLNPEGDGNTASCIMMQDLVVDADLYDVLFHQTPRMKGHVGKKPIANTIAVYVIGKNGESELRSIDGIIDCITMLMYAGVLWC